MMVYRENLVVIILLFFCAFTSFASDKVNIPLVNSVVLEMDKETVFDKTVDYLQDNGYFINELEKSAGFIQMKIDIRSDKIFASKRGELRTYNFIIRSVAENHSKITLNIFYEDLYYQDENFIYDAKKLSKDAVLYQTILKELQKVLE